MDTNNLNTSNERYTCYFSAHLASNTAKQNLEANLALAAEINASWHFSRIMPCMGIYEEVEEISYCLQALTSAEVKRLVELVTGKYKQEAVLVVCGIPSKEERLTRLVTGYDNYGVAEIAALGTARTCGKAEQNRLVNSRQDCTVNLITGECLVFKSEDE